MSAHKYLTGSPSRSSDSDLIPRPSILVFPLVLRAPPRVAMENHVSGQSNKELTKLAHALETEDLVRQLEADSENGLTKSQATERHGQYGPNELDDGPGVQPLKILIAQVANAMMLVLILAMAVSFGIESWIEGGVVTAIIILNVVVGFLQEYQAEKTMDSLRSLSSPTANVIREGSSVNIPSSEITIGDIVELKVGDTVPADIRFVHLAPVLPSQT